MTTAVGRSGQPLAQRPRELRGLLDLLVREDVRAYAEIGVRDGDTFCAVADALRPGARLVAVDWPGAAWGRADAVGNLRAAVAYATACGHDAHLIVGDSTDAATVAAVAALGPFDAVFIDGDHRAAGVRADWTHYGPLARLVAFHDIAPLPENTRVEVPVVWREIVAAAGGHVLEIHDPDAPGMGIGVCWPKPVEVATECP